MNNMDVDDDEEKKPKSNHSLEEEFALVKQELEQLKNEYALLKEENEKLVDFKKNEELKQKDALIESFYMLSDEDKEDVIKNKANYSLDDIEAKLSIICVRKKVNFAKAEDEEENLDVTTYNLNQTEADPLPAWLRAVESRRNKDNF